MMYVDVLHCKKLERSDKVWFDITDTDEGREGSFLSDRIVLPSGPLFP